MQDIIVFNLNINKSVKIIRKISTLNIHNLVITDIKQVPLLMQKTHHWSLNL